MRIREFAAARRSLAAFAVLAGVPLRPWQLAAFDLSTRVTCVIAGRQSGKSLSIAVLGLWQAYRAREQEVLIVSAGEDASRRVLSEVRTIATRAPMLQGSVADEQASLVVLSNGSRLKSVPASERQIRGERADLLLVDEAALVPDDVLLGAAMPTTAARPRGRTVLVSTATVSAGAFYDHAMAGDAGSAHIRTHRWVSTLVGGDCAMDWLSPSAIAAARETMSAERFSAEFEANFAAGADRLLTPAALAAVTADYAPTPLGALTGPAGLLAGIDWAGGMGRDRSTLVALGRPLLADAEPRFAVVTAHGWHPGTQPHRVIEDIAATRATWAALMPEANGLGWPLTKQLTRAMADRPRRLGGGQRRRGVVLIDPLAGSWEAQIAEQTGVRHAPWWDADGPPLPPPAVIRPVHVSAELKMSAYGTLRLLVHRGWLLLPTAAIELRRELTLLRTEVTAAGIERIETGGRDFASALMLSTGPYRHRGQWRSLLLELAEQHARLPASTEPLAIDALPTVRTGAGLEIPRAPAWLGVADDAVTLPPGVVLGTAPTPEDRERDAMRERVWRMVDERQQEEAVNGG